MWTKTSFSPDSGWMKPKPFWALNHLTVPIDIAFFQVRKCTRRGVAQRIKFRQGTESGSGRSMASVEHRPNLVELTRKIWRCSERPTSASAETDADIGFRLRTMVHRCSGYVRCLFLSPALGPGSVK